MNRKATWGNFLLPALLMLVLPFSAFPFDPQNNPPAVDPRDSRFCLSCHDGTIAVNVLSQDQRTGSGAFLGYTPNNFCLERSHPIGIYYPLAQLRSKGRLKDLSQLDPAVQLREGHVTCSSCHDSRSQLPAKLVMSNGGSRLCFSCHNL